MEQPPGFDPDEFQHFLNERDSDDDLPIGITRYQAQKSAAIILAGIDGHTAYLEASATVARYLQTLALEAIPTEIHRTQDSAHFWRIIDELPWPAPGAPTAQPS